MTRTYDIKPIETTYQGVAYRSRLEVLWRVFFDALDVPCAYEPQYFTLSNGDRYLPDFMLVKTPFTMCEIKPTTLEPEERAKCAMLSKKFNVFSIAGSPLYRFEVELFQKGQQVDRDFGNEIVFRLKCKLGGVNPQYMKNYLRLQYALGRGINKGFEAVEEFSFD